MDKELATRIKNSIYGFIFGDCVGLPYEFKQPEEIKFKMFDSHGTFDQEAGTYSDDTALMLSFMDSFDEEKNFSIEKHKENLKFLLKGEFSVDNNLFDIGRATQNAINADFTKQNFNQYGNGGLLRCWLFAAGIIAAEIAIDHPIFFKRPYFENEIDLLELTHSSNIPYLNAFNIYLSIMTFVYLGRSIEDIQCFLKKSDTVQGMIFFIEKNNELNKVGTIFNSLLIIIDSIFEKRTIQEVIELGGDTDSNAALYGAICGGLNPISKVDLKKIRDIERIDKFINNFLKNIS